VAVEVATNKVVYFLFGEGVQVLELVEGAELLDTQAVWGDYVRFAFEKVLGLVAGYLTDCGEDVGAVAGCSFHAVSVVDATLAGFFVTVELVC